ncbi:sodium/potassium/calcium exchanger 4-like [Fopius arisanus]|uniref:Slc24a5_0 protein n=1 Tax=Fopius arisanus TaxID=64838 RepID=A0A0C9RHY4_9HYME|nr:PREDICTED: sodium/potassium/calcium exchanger 4-like [Fopius arisanus]
MTIRLHTVRIAVVVLVVLFVSIGSGESDEVRRQWKRQDSNNFNLLTLTNTSDNGTHETNCSPHSMEEFPTDLFTPAQRKNGAVLLHAFFGFYCFLLTAYVCNDYLLPALDIICAELKISADVAGATFLATASCFPELFVNVVGTFVTESDLGVGTVVGGAVFNTFATPAFGALSAAQSIPLDSWILSRDCIIYVFSVSALVMVMWDGRVKWYESLVLIILFTGYFATLFLNNKVIFCTKKIKELFRKKSQLQNENEGRSEHEDMPSGSYKPFVHGDLVIEYRKSIQHVKRKEMEEGKSCDKCTENVEEYIEPASPLHCPTGGIWSQCWFLFTWPAKVILFLTIPDTRWKKFKNWYPLTFIMCVCWIAVSTYLVSWMMTIVGDTLGISDSIMGITFLSAGGNMPELVSIVILSRQGNGNMAMSNTLGANTLDVLMCLGLPWAIKSIMSGSDIIIESGAIAYSVLSIIVCVVGFFSVTAYYKFNLNRQVGIACLIMYSLFLTFTILLESNVFWQVNQPTCKN